MSIDGTAIPATLVNFTAGVLFLGIVWGGIALASGHGLPALPHDWRLYLGGPLGCVFIGVGAMVVPRLGVFAATLGLVSGNLLGSLVVDLVAPTDGSTVTTTTVLGTLGALAAATAAVVSLTACSSGTGGGESFGGDIALSYAIWDENQKPAMQEIAAAFEKENPNVTIDIQVTPYKEYFTKLQTAATGGSAAARCGAGVTCSRLIASMPEWAARFSASNGASSRSAAGGST